MRSLDRATLRRRLRHIASRPRGPCNEMSVIVSAMVSVRRVDHAIGSRRPVRDAASKSARWGAARPDMKIEELMGENRRLPRRPGSVERDMGQHEGCRYDALEEMESAAACETTFSMRAGGRRPRLMPFSRRRLGNFAGVDGRAAQNSAGFARMPERQSRSDNLEHDQEGGDSHQPHVRCYPPHRHHVFTLPGPYLRRQRHSNIGRRDIMPQRRAFPWRTSDAVFRISRSVRRRNCGRGRARFPQRRMARRRCSSMPCIR